MLLAAMVTIMLFREFAASMAEGRGPPGLDLVITTITPMIIVGGIIGLYDRFVVKTLLDILGWLLGVIGDAGGTLAAEMFTVTIGAIIGAMIANFQGLTMGSWWEGLKAMAPALVNVGILTLALLMVVWAICEFVCVIAKGGILLAIGLAFGPIMMVFATTSMFRDFFSKWMGFVLGAIMTMVIGFMLASIMIVFLDPLVKLYANGSAGFTDTLLVLIMTYVMKEVISAAPTIASGLVPGHLGIGAGNTSRAIALQGSAAAAMLPLKATSFASKGAQMGLRGVEKGLGTASTKASDAAGKFRKGVDGAIGKAADWRQRTENAANWKPNRPPPKPPDKPGP